MILRDIRKHEMKVDHFAMKRLSIRKFAAAILELSDHGCPECPVIAGGKINAPPFKLGIVQTQA